MGWVLPHVFRLRTKADITQCSYLLCAPFRGADGQVINLAPIRTYLSVSAHARVWRTIQDSNLKPIAYKATALPLELSRLIWRDDVESNHDKQVNSLP